MSLIEVFQRELLSDDECPDKKSTRLLEKYDNANESEKTTINELFIDLCGWSFETLKELTDKEENQLQDKGEAVHEQ